MAAMRAIQVVGEGKDARLVPAEAAKPELRAGEIRVAVAATAVNRADLMQRRGLYPPPPGASPILGLECAGVVTEVGPGATGFARGDRVMALLGGGGYAEEVCVDADLLRVAAPAEQRHHAVAAREARRARPDLGHHAGA